MLLFLNEKKFFVTFYQTAAAKFVESLEKYFGKKKEKKYFVNVN